MGYVNKQPSQPGQKQLEKCYDGPLVLVSGCNMFPEHKERGLSIYFVSEKGPRLRSTVA